MTLNNGRRRPRQIFDRQCSAQKTSSKILSILKELTMSLYEAEEPELELNWPVIMTKKQLQISAGGRLSPESVLYPDPKIESQL